MSVLKIVCVSYSLCNYMNNRIVLGLLILLMISRELWCHLRSGWFMACQTSRLKSKYLYTWAGDLGIKLRALQDY